MAARVDEDGRCLLTELLPDQCACPDHRASPDLTAIDLRTLTVVAIIEASYRGRCAVDSEHPIWPGDEIGLMQTGVDESVGWACEKCTEQVKAHGRS